MNLPQGDLRPPPLEQDKQKAEKIMSLRLKIIYELGALNGIPKSKLPSREVESERNNRIEEYRKRLHHLENFGYDSEQKGDYVETDRLF